MESPEEMDGKLYSDNEVERLAKTLLEDDGQKTQQGELLNEAMNNNTNAFVPDLMFEQICKNYQTAKQLYGPRMLRELTGHSAETLERNRKIPEFQRDLERTLGSKIKTMKKQGLLDKEGNITEEGVALSAIVMMTKELDKLIPKGSFGQYHHHKKIHVGTKQDIRPYRKHDRYNDIAVQQSVKTALRRGHAQLERGDLKVYERNQQGNVTIIYAIDASGSMKGAKIDMAKKAGVALSYKAIQDKNKVGLIVFASEVSHAVKPTKDFTRLLMSMQRTQASKETNMMVMLDKAMEMTSKISGSKHLILLTDGMPTVGEDPQELCLRKIRQAKASGMSVSMIGLQLHRDDEQFAQELVDAGGGRLYIVNNVDDTDVVVLQEYAAAS